MQDLLKKRWYSFCGIQGCSPQSTESIYGAIVDSYSQYFRQYHQLGHLAGCFIQLDGIRPALNDPEVVEYALWFHDIVCVPRASSNEMLSAAAAGYAANRLGLSDRFGARAAELILLTNHKATASDNDGAYFTDIDLTIFGQSWQGFMDYERQIRAEYSSLSEKAYRQGRIQVVRFFLDKKTIYQTQYFREKFEENARQNLLKLLKFLES
ncbi:hypothetical protein [Sporomusa aerivorans]|uniref:HD domain-containing protein n=1 Tax=Sporomusa aerivorans TaxID=204936 RepID=UPI00352B233E